MVEEKVQIGEHLAGVVQSPDGEIQYYTTPTIKNKHNPYLQKSILQDEESGVESGVEYREVECNGDRIIILAQDIDRALQLECNAMVIRFICLLDFIINVFFILNTYYVRGFFIFNTYYVTGFFIAIISMCGYFSTITYNRRGLIGYLIYKYLQSIGKLILLTMYITAATSQQFRITLQKENIQNLNPTPENIIILSGISLGQIYITYFVQRFYNRLKGTPLRPQLRSD